MDYTLIEAAQEPLGCPPITRRFWNITLRLAIPGIVAGWPCMGVHFAGGGGVRHPRLSAALVTLMIGKRTPVERVLQQP